MPPRRAATRVLLVLSTFGCASPGDVASDHGEDMGGLDPDVPPLVEGDWWRPQLGDDWQWQLTTADGGELNLGYDVAIYDLDLFDVPSSTIESLHGDGRHVLCYLSAGSFEAWRPDAERFSKASKGKTLDGWPGERWLDVRDPEVFEIMISRLDLAVAKGCDGVEPDNVDGYTNATGFPLSADDQLAFNRNLANAAHRRGLAVALKNSGDQAVELEPYFDLELNEQCHQYDECEQLTPFIDAGKPVLNAEYTKADTAEAADELAAEICPAATSARLETLILPWDLDDAFRVACAP